MNRRATLLFFCYLCPLLYLSLHTAHPNLGPLENSLRWHPILGRTELIDFSLNVVFYAPLGAAACIALRSSLKAILGATLICGLISLSVEYAQLSIPSRDADLRDLLANSLGALLGACVASLASRESVARRLRSYPKSQPLFLFLWVAWQALLLLRAPWSITLISHEFVGLLVLVMVFTRKVSRLAAPLLLVWLAVEELRPFVFRGPPGDFSWTPFAGWFAGAPETYYGVVAGKFFLYTAVIWVLRRSGAPMLWAFLAPAAILSIGEWLQRYQPGRSPEITDLVLLAAGGILLHVTGADD